MRASAIPGKAKLASRSAVTGVLVGSSPTPGATGRRLRQPDGLQIRRRAWFDSCTACGVTWRRLRLCVSRLGREQVRSLRWPEDPQNSVRLRDVPSRVDDSPRQCLVRRLGTPAACRAVSRGVQSPYEAVPGWSRKVRHELWVLVSAGSIPVTQMKVRRTNNPQPPSSFGSSDLLRASSSVGRAPRWHRGGQRFDPAEVHVADVADGEAVALPARLWEFDSPHPLSCW